MGTLAALLPISNKAFPLFLLPCSGLPCSFFLFLLEQGFIQVHHVYPKIQQLLRRLSTRIASPRLQISILPHTQAHFFRRALLRYPQFDAPCPQSSPYRASAPFLQRLAFSIRFQCTDPPSSLTDHAHNRSFIIAYFHYFLYIKTIFFLFRIINFLYGRFVFEFLFAGSVALRWQKSVENAFLAYCIKKAH